MLLRNYVEDPPGGEYLLFLLGGWYPLAILDMAGWKMTTFNGEMWENICGRPDGDEKRGERCNVGKLHVVHIW